jgi:hypothetical protein
VGGQIEDTAPSVRGDIDSIGSPVRDAAGRPTATFQVLDHHGRPARKPAVSADRFVGRDRLVMHAGEVASLVRIVGVSETSRITLVHTDPQHGSQEVLDEELGEHAKVYAHTG